MSLMKRKMNKKGFTLVELIIVIAVMAILAAVVVPRMSGITESFKVKADQRIAESIGRELEVKVLAGVTLAANSGLASTELSDSGIAAPEQKDVDAFYYIYTAFVPAVIAADGSITTAAIPGSIQVYAAKTSEGVAATAAQKKSLITRNNVSPIE